MRIAVLQPGLALALTVAALAADRPSRAILVSMDGLRGDALTPELMPRLRALAQRGAATRTARSLSPTYTIPNHVSMLTGVTPATHGVVAIVDAGDIRVDGTVAEILRGTGFTTGIYLSKDKLDILAKPGAFDRYFEATTGSSAGAVAALRADLAAPETRPDFAFLHIVEPDAVGHREGWGSGAYLDAVRAADGHLGDVLDELERQGLVGETLVIVTADHGGLGFNHGLESPEVLEIPWIAAGPGVPPGIPIEQQVELHDTAPTILAAFGVELPVAIEGKVVTQAVRDGAARLRRGDVDSSGSVDVGDVVALFGHAFLGRPAACAAAGDSSGDGRLDVTDCVVLLHHLLRAGPPPPEPYPECGAWPGALDGPCAGNPCG